MSNIMLFEEIFYCLVQW